jgi:hypothetical protein
MNSHGEDIYSSEFYYTLKNWVVSLVFFSVLFGLSYSGLFYFKRNKIGNDKKGQSNHITLFLCAVGLTIAISIPILLPVTIVSDALLRANPQSAWLHWFHSNLIFGLWNYLFLATSGCLFVILPFAYFWQEAEGVGTGRGLLPRVYEATLVLFLFIALIVGLMSVAHNFIYFLPDDIFAYLPFAYSLITLVGSGIVMVCMPRGFTTLTKEGFEMFRPLRILFNADTERLLLLLEKESLELKLSQNITEFGDFEKEQLSKRLKQLKQRLTGDIAFEHTTRSNLRHFGKAMWWLLQNGMALLVTECNLLLPALIATKTILGTLSPILQSFLKLDMVFGTFISSIYVTIVETVLVLYTSISAFVGLYHSQWFQGWRPKKRDTPMYRIVINTFVILVISSALPVVSRILGLVTFDLMEYYKYTDYMRNTYFIMTYKILFVLKLAQRYFELFPFMNFFSFRWKEQSRDLKNAVQLKRE